MVVVVVGVVVVVAVVGVVDEVGVETVVGVGVAATTVVVVAVGSFVLPRILPDRLGVIGAPGGSPREYMLEMDLRGPSPLIGETVESAGLRHLPGLFLVRIERSTGVLSPVGPGERLREGDRLTFAGVIETIVDLQRFRGLDRNAFDLPRVLVQTAGRPHAGAARA